MKKILESYYNVNIYPNCYFGGRTILKKTLQRSVFLCLIAVLLISTVINAATDQINYDSIDMRLSKLVKRMMIQDGIPGVSILVIDNDHTWIRDYGYMNREHKTNFTSKSIIKVGDVSRVFTATAIMKLAEEGKIDIDAPIQTYIPEFTMKFHYPTNPITIRSLLADHSGLPMMYFKKWINDEIPFLEDLIDDLKEEYIAHPPNSYSAKSPIGYSLLGVVIERVTGDNFYDFMNENILEPLQMNRSSFIIKPELGLYLSPGHYKRKPYYEKYLRDTPNDGLYSSAKDLSNFVRMILNKGTFQGETFLNDSSIDEMLRQQNQDIALDLDKQFGLGWNLNNNDELSYVGTKTVEQVSGNLFYGSYILLLPESKFGLIVVMNSSPADINGSVAEIAKVLIEAKTGLKAPQIEKPTVIQMTRDQVAQYEGDFATSSGLLQIKRKRKGLVIAASEISCRMIPHADNWFAVDPLIFRVIPLFEPYKDFRITMTSIAGQRLLIRSTKGLPHIFGAEIKPFPIPESWRSRSGEYVIDDQDYPVDFHVEIKSYQDYLLFSLTGGGKDSMYELVLKPINEDEAILQGYDVFGRETVRFIKNLDGREILFFSGLKFKKMN